MNCECAAGIVREVMAGEPSLIYTRHALERMRERFISRADVRTVLSRCRVSRIEPDHQGVRWVAEGKDLDERSLQIVIAAIDAGEKSVVVITAIAP